MDVKDLYAFILVLLISIILLAVGMVTWDKFRENTLEEANIGLETIAISGGAGQTIRGGLTDVNYFGNATFNTSNDNASIDSPTIGDTINWTSSGVITVNTSFSDGSDTYQISYVVDEASPATRVLGNSTIAISPISNTWLTVIVTVAMAAIVLKLVIGGFGASRR